MQIRSLLFIVGAVLLMSIGSAMANTISVDPDTISLGESTTAELCAGTTSFTITNVELKDPNGNSYTTNENVGTTLNPGECALWNIPDDFSTTINQIGTWTIVIDTNPGNRFVYDFTVSFFVVPEAIIGAAAMIGAMFSIFIAYNHLKKRN